MQMMIEYERAEVPKLALADACVGSYDGRSAEGNTW
jgi:hypothetical protein